MFLFGGNMYYTIIGVLLGGVISIVVMWFTQKWEAKKLKMQLKYECLKEEIDELKVAFSKFKEQIWESVKRDSFHTELWSEIVSLYPEEIKDTVFSLLKGGISKKTQEDLNKVRMEIAEIFKKMNNYIKKKRREIIKEI